MRAVALWGVLAVIPTGDGMLRPAPRSGHALVYDSVRRTTLLINGDHDLERTAGEVWGWETTAAGRRRSVSRGLSTPSSPWRLIDTSGPPPRTLAGVAFDSRRGVVVMQGGIGPRDTLFGDTQEWDGHQWRAVAGEGPGVRNHHAMVYDEARRHRSVWRSGSKHHASQ